MRRDVSDDEEEFEGLDQFNQDEKTKKIFRDLTERHNINTEGLELINISITYGSKYAVAIVNDSENTDVDHFEVKGFSLSSFT